MMADWLGCVQESPGPCQEGQYFAYNSTSRQTECSCFKNHVYSPSSQSCVELFTQGQGSIVEGSFLNLSVNSSQLAFYIGDKLFY